MRNKRRLKKGLILFATVVIVLASVMSVTKPSKERYTRWALEKVSQRAEKKNPMMGLGLSLFGQRMIEEGTTVSDYGVIRLFKTEFQGKEIKVVGILGMLIPVGKRDLNS